VDHVGEIVEDWRRLRPELDLTPMLIVGRIHRLGRIMDDRLRPTFAAAGLAQGDFDILAALRRGSPDHDLTAGELHRALMVTSGAITKQVDRLASKGLVTRKIGPEDARVRLIVLTAAGRRLVDGLIGTHLANEEALLESVDRRQRDALADALRLLSTGLEGDPGLP
jgi:DNA-binding MarR family transcriptional regulator